MSELKNQELPLHIQNLYEDSKRDDYMILGSEVRMVVFELQKAINELKALRSSIRETCGHDGSCESCGAIPTIQMPYQLCDECRTKRDTELAAKDARIAELELEVSMSEEDVLQSYEWSTLANWRKQQVESARTAGNVFPEPGITCTNERAEAAESKLAEANARIAELTADREQSLRDSDFMAHREHDMMAKLAAVSEVLKEKPRRYWGATVNMYRCKDIDPLLARLRSIVEGK